jgi:hypothetical protein
MMLKASDLWNSTSVALIVILASALLVHGQNVHGQNQEPATGACLTDCVSGQSSGESTDNLRVLMQTLGTAYRNSLLHDAPNTDLEASDLRLETSSVTFSLRMLDEIGKSVCQSSDPATPTVVGQQCAFDNQLAGLSNLTDSLSYAAYRLERTSDSLSRADLSSSEESLTLPRIRSMEHLYRMVFALSQLYLDSTQSAVYLQAADEQLQMARSFMENERAVCACDPPGYVTRLAGLSQLSNRIAELRGASLP